jgi:hypothetical protein
MFMQAIFCVYFYIAYILHYIWLWQNYKRHFFPKILSPGLDLTFFLFRSRFVKRPHLTALIIEINFLKISRTKNHLVLNQLWRIFLHWFVDFRFLIVIVWKPITMTGWLRTSPIERLV